MSEEVSVRSSRDRSEENRRYREKMTEEQKERYRESHRNWYAKAAQEPWRMHVRKEGSNWRGRMRTQAQKAGLSLAEYLKREGLTWKQTDEYRRAVAKQEQMKRAWEQGHGTKA